MLHKIKITRLLILAIFFMAILPSILISILLLNDHYHEAKQAVHSEMNGNLNNLVNEFLHKFNADSININLLASEQSLNEGIKDILVTEDAYNQIHHFHKLSSLKHSTYLLSNNLTVIENVNGTIKRFENSTLLKRVKEEIDREPLKKGEQIILNFSDPILLSKLVIGTNSCGSGYAIIAPVFNQALLYNDKMLPTGYLVSISSYQEVIGLFDFNATDIISIGDSSSTFSVKNAHIKQVDSLNHMSELDNTQVNFTFKSDSSRNDFLLNFKSFRASKSIGEYLVGFLDTLAIGVILTLIFSSIASIALFRWLNRPFKQLGEIIKSFHCGIYQISNHTNLRFFELQEIVDLLKSLGAQINNQITALKKQNIELSKLAELKATYLTELQTLNLELEQRVNQQTIKISNSLQREEQNRLLLQQLASAMVKIQKSSSIKDVLNLSLIELTNIMPDTAVSIQFPPDSGFAYKIEHELIDKKTIQKLNQLIWSDLCLMKQNSKPCISIYEKVFCLFYIRNNTGEKLACIVIEDTNFGIDTIEIFHLFIRQIDAIVKNVLLYNEVERLSRIDALTNIGNRKAFNDALLRATKHHQRYQDEHFGLFMIDINGLKPVNDEYGHEQGDTLICALSDFLEENIRDTDQVFRLAGDEFAILLNKGNTESCLLLNNRLMTKATNKGVTLTLDESHIVELPMSFSCGYASTENSNIDKLFSDADEHMYRQKQRHYSNNVK